MGIKDAEVKSVVENFSKIKSFPLDVVKSKNGIDFYFGKRKLFGLNQRQINKELKLLEKSKRCNIYFFKMAFTNNKFYIDNRIMADLLVSYKYNLMPDFYTIPAVRGSMLESNDDFMRNKKYAPSAESGFYSKFTGMFGINLKFVRI